MPKYYLGTGSFTHQMQTSICLGNTQTMTLTAITYLRLAQSDHQGRMKYGTQKSMAPIGAPDRNESEAVDKCALGRHYSATVSRRVYSFRK